MKKVLIIFGIILMLIIVVFSGCLGDSVELNRFVGRWESSGIASYTFFSDRTCHSPLMGGIGTYKIDDGKLIVGWGLGQYIYDYQFSFNDRKLILYNLENNMTHDMIKQ